MAVPDESQKKQPQPQRHPSAAEEFDYQQHHQQHHNAAVAAATAVPTTASSSSSSAATSHASQQAQPAPTAAPQPYQPYQQDAAGVNAPGSMFHSLSYAYRTYLRHDTQEQNHWEDVCRSYRQYATFAMAQWANHQYRLHSLPENHRALLPPALRRDTPEFLQRANAFKDAAIRNQYCLDCILRHAGQAHSQEYNLQHREAAVAAGDQHPKPPPPTPHDCTSTDAQMSKVSSVLKSLVRDWSAEGRPERDMAYKPILALVQKYLPIHAHRAPPRVSVPGAGVGRLALELRRLGYTVQGNEFSLYMLLASDFMLNGGVATPGTPLAISPWLLESRNLHAAVDQLRVVQIPDVDPYTLLMGSQEPDGSGARAQPEFSMAAGEFVSIYDTPREQGTWDAVVACFFIDASPSVVEYLQVIYNMLKPGGVFCNFGPLLWHWSGPAMRSDDKTIEDYQKRYDYLDKKYLTSIDVCFEDVLHIMGNVGFEILEQKTGIRALYTADRRSMMNMDYRCVSFVARKPYTVDQHLEEILKEDLGIDEAT